MKPHLSLGLLALSHTFAFANEDLIVNKVLIKSAGGAPGYECFEIKNVGAGTIELADEHIALVGINNLHPSKGKIDFWYEFTGRVASGDTVCVRSKSGAGRPPSVETAFALSNGDEIRSEFFPGHTGMDLPDNGDNFILVKGFHKDAVNPRTKAPYAFGDTLDNDGDFYFDFLSTPSRSDDLWDTALDALVVAPDTKHFPTGWDNYALGLDVPHYVAGLSNPDWTGAYFIRLQNQDTGAYDEALQMDTLPKDAKDQILSGDHIGLLSRHAFTIPRAATRPVRFFVTYAAGGNISDWEGFTGLEIGGHLYVH